MAEEESIQFMVGEIYVTVSQDQAEELLSQETERCEADLEAIEEKIRSVRQTLAQLKVKLYAKFGDQINLEDGSDD